LRADIKIHRIIEELVRTRNEIYNTFSGRPLSIFGLTFGGSTTAEMLDSLIDDIKIKFLEKPNYSFDIKTGKNHLIEITWTEEFSQSKNVKLELTDSNPRPSISW